MANRPGKGPLKKSGGGGGGLIGMIAKMAGAGKAEEAPKAMNEAGQEMIPETGPYKDPGFWGALAGNPANDYNFAWRMQQQGSKDQLANSTAIARLHHELGAQLQDKAASDALRLEEVRANVAGAAEANRLRMQAEAEENKRRAGLQHQATARAQLAGELGNAPYAPDYFDFGRAQENAINAEMARGLKSVEDKDAADLAFKQTQQKLGERSLRMPVNIGDKFLWDEKGGLQTIIPSQEFTTPPTRDPNNLFKFIPGQTHRTPARLSGSGMSAGQEFVLGKPDATSANTGERTTQFTPLDAVNPVNLGLDTNPPSTIPAAQPALFGSVPQIPGITAIRSLSQMMPKAQPSTNIPDEDPQLTAIKRLLQQQQKIVRTY